MLGGIYESPGADMGGTGAGAGSWGAVFGAATGVFTAGGGFCIGGGPIGDGIIGVLPGTWGTGAVGVS